MNANDYKQMLINAYKDQELSVEDFENTLMQFAKLIHFADLRVKESLIEQFKTKVDMENKTSNTNETAAFCNTMLAAGADSLVGKYFELLNIDGSVMHRFKIKHVKKETTPSIEHSDGSRSPSTEHIWVSAEGSGWFRLYGGKTDRVIAS